jgi:hypothetical protein
LIPLPVALRDPAATACPASPSCEQDPAYKKKIDEEKRARFKAKKEQEEKDNPVPKFGIIIPLAPFGERHRNTSGRGCRLQGMKAHACAAVPVLSCLANAWETKGFNCAASYSFCSMYCLVYRLNLSLSLTLARCCYLATPHPAGMPDYDETERFDLRVGLYCWQLEACNDHEFQQQAGRASSCSAPCRQKGHSCQQPHLHITRHLAAAIACRMSLYY